MSTKAWRQSNKKKIHARVKAWRDSNKEIVNKRARDWKKANPEKVWADNLMQKYGITPDDYNWMYEVQLGFCAICFRRETQKHPKTGELQRLTVDHCHDTGKVRGLLCHKCNKGIGLFKESVETLNKAISYLGKFS